MRIKSKKSEIQTLCTFGCSEMAEQLLPVCSLASTLGGGGKIRS